MNCFFRATGEKFGRLTNLVFERAKKNCPTMSVAVAFTFLSKVMRHISKYYRFYDCDTLQGTKKMQYFQLKEKES